MYLGNSDGTDPFVAGLIENNLIKDTIGYNLQIKYQLTWPFVPGMPTSPSSTIIRNNVFIKNDQASPDGDRTNVLVGGFPDTGNGSSNLYQVYGNFFDHNPREALFQGSGRVVLHDNILVDAQYTAIALRAAELPLKLAYVYDNTVYTSQQGVYIGTRPTIDYTVVGNLIFAGTPLAGYAISGVSNMTDSLANAANFVNAPSFTLGSMDFYPHVGMVLGPGINFTKFVSNADYTLDFNGASKNSLGGVVFRGAYAGQGLNPGWKLQAGTKPVENGGRRVASCRRPGVRQPALRPVGSRPAQCRSRQQSLPAPM